MTEALRLSLAGRLLGALGGATPYRLGQCMRLAYGTPAQQASAALSALVRAGEARHHLTRMHRGHALFVPTPVFEANDMRRLMDHMWRFVRQRNQQGEYPTAMQIRADAVAEYRVSDQRAKEALRLLNHELEILPVDVPDEDAEPDEQTYKTGYQALR